MAGKLTAVLLMAASLLLSGCIQRTATSRVIISAEDSKLVFDPGGDEPLVATYFFQTAANYAATTYSGLWRPRKKQSFPHAWLYLTELSPGYYLTDTGANIDDYIERLKFGELGKAELRGKGSVENVLGTTKYRRFEVGSGNCVAFIVNWGVGEPSAITVGSNRIIGHYCAPKNADLGDARVAEIINGIGAKGHAVPDTVAAPRQARAESELKDLGFTLNWRRFRENLEGVFKLSDSGDRGRMFVSIPGGGDCSGKWTRVSGKFDSPELPHGTWSILCTNGRTASGVYRLSQPFKGVGEGKDGDGNQVKFSIGGA